MKQCSICKEKKELDEFPFQNKKLNKRMSACKSSNNDLSKMQRRR